MIIFNILLIIQLLLITEFSKKMNNNQDYY